MLELADYALRSNRLARLYGTGPRSELAIHEPFGVLGDARPEVKFKLFSFDLLLLEIPQFLLFCLTFLKKQVFGLLVPSLRGVVCFRGKSVFLALELVQSGAFLLDELILEISVLNASLVQAFADIQLWVHWGLLHSRRLIYRVCFRFACNFVR